jgi:hypothetical protein
MLLLLVVVAIVIRLSLPVGLIQISANMSNLSAMIFPFVIIYLNRRLPRAGPAELVPHSDPALGGGLLRLLLRELRHGVLLPGAAGHVLEVGR